LAVDYFAILATHHQLLEQTAAAWLNIAGGDLHGGGLDQGEGPVTWDDFLRQKLPPIEAVPVAVGGEAPADDDREDDDLGGLVSLQAPVQSDGGVEFVDRDWVKIIKSLKQKFIAWIKSSSSSQISLAGRLVVMRLSMDPLVRLMHTFLELAGRKWEEQQEAKAAAGQPRSYRVLEACRGEDANNFCQDLGRSHHTIPVALPLKDMNLASRNLFFRLLSRAGCNLPVTLLPSRKGCPVMLFSCLLDGDAATLFYQQRKCLHDSLTAAFVHSFPTAEAALSPTGQDILLSLALIIDMDISQIEAKHAAVRRIVKARSLQTCGMQLEDLSCDFLLRQNAADFVRVCGRNVFEGEGQQKRKRKKKMRKVRKDGKIRKRPVPGPFKTYLHLTKQGIQWKDGAMTKFAEEYRSLPPEEKAHFEHVAAAAALSVEHGHAPFGAKPGSSDRALALPSANTVELALVRAKEEAATVRARALEEAAHVNATLQAFDQVHHDSMSAMFTALLGQDFHRCIAGPLAAFDIHLPADALYCEVSWLVML